MKTLRGWMCVDRLLPVFDRVLVMGILNVTPDSFSDGGQFVDPAIAMARALEMQSEGADIIDIGGESTRPGAHPVPADLEIERVVPVIKEITARSDIPVSIDTTKAGVARAALEAGAIIVNDVSAMRFDEGMPKVVAGSKAGLVLMHMAGEPRTMQENPVYEDVVGEVKHSLVNWASLAENAGISRESIAVDPGIGFGKTVPHNLALVRDLLDLTDSGYPILIGPSRKAFIGHVLNQVVEDRLEGTEAVVAWAVSHGANIVRVHDVGPMVHVVRMIEAIQSARPRLSEAG